MKKILILMFLLITLQSKAQEIILTESGDTLVTLTKKEVGTINKAFVDLKYTKLELIATDSINAHLNNSILLQDSIIKMKDSQLNLQEKELKKVKKDKIKTGLYGGGIGLLIGLILGILL